MLTNYGDILKENRYDFNRGAYLFLFFVSLAFMRII